MNTKIITLLTLLFVTTIGVNAQSKESEKSIEFGGMFEVGDDILPLKNVSALSLAFVNGCRTNDYFFIGGGIGIDYSTWEALGYSSVYSCYSVSLPLFIRAKVYFSNEDIAPFLSFDLGYNLMIGSTEDYCFDGISNEYAYKRSGIFISPSLGTDFKIDDKTIMYIGLSYMLNSFGENNHSYSHSYNSIGFKIGCKF